VTNANSGTPSSGSTISQYDIDAGGELSPKNPAVVTTPFSPAGIVVSPDGQSVYVASHALDVVSQYDVGAGGALSPKSPPLVSTPGEGPFAVAVSPDGRSLYVTGLATDNGPGIVSQYDIGAGGKLSPKSPPTVAAGTTPTGVAVRPDGASAYVVDATGNDVLQYDLGAGGTLTPKSPPSVAAGMNPGKVALSADGHDAYVTNENDNSVSQYTVGAGGALSPKSPAAVPVGRAPFGIAVRSTLGTPPPPPTIGDVIASIQALGLPGGTENALLAKLNGAQQSLDGGQSGAACNALGAFVNQVNAQSGKKIAAGDAQSLTDQAAAVQQSLGCG
jgi:DNA-binding beta-propeller fold protein YncE